VCTIVVWSRVLPGAELVVLANRDEFYARPSEPPQVLDAESGAVGGRDVTGGGTWMGATPSGFFVALTNQRTWSGADRSRESRGAVALEALRRGSTEGVRGLLEELEPSDYNPFNLIYGDHRALSVAYARSDGVEHVDLPPGIHVLTNDRIGSPDFPKAARALSLAASITALRTEEDFQLAQRLLADHQTPRRESLPQPPPDSPFTAELVEALQAICIHTPIYGTRSAAALVADARGVLDYRYTDGPPCVAPLECARHLFETSVR
jgi:uncharacterized protein with NRDE domain